MSKNYTQDEWGKICPSCGGKKQAEDKFCPECQSQLCPICEEEKTGGEVCIQCKRQRCPMCKKVLSEGIYCKSCRSELESKGWKVCKRCNKKTSATSDYCKKCSFAICPDCFSEVDTPGKCAQCQSKDRKELVRKNIKWYAMALVCVLLFIYGIKSCSDSNAEEKRIAIEQEKQLQKEREELREQERREEQLFNASSEKIRIYEQYGSKEWLQRITYPAKRALQKYAHDSESVQDVVATSEIFRVRMKDYPECRFLVRVSFRAKNTFGAVVKQQAIVIFDNDLQPIAVLADMP